MWHKTVTLGLRHVAGAFGLPVETLRAWLRREVVSFRRAGAGLVLSAPELSALNIVCSLRRLGVRGRVLGVAFDRVRVGVRQAEASGGTAFAWLPGPRRVEVLVVPRERAEAVAETFPLLDLTALARAYADVLADLEAVRLPAFRRREMLQEVAVAQLN